MFPSLILVSEAVESAYVLFIISLTNLLSVFFVFFSFLQSFILSFLSVFAASASFSIFLHSLTCHSFGEEAEILLLLLFLLFSVSSALYSAPLSLLILHQQEVYRQKLPDCDRP